MGKNASSVKGGAGSGWITVLKVIAIIQCVALTIAGGAVGGTMGVASRNTVFVFIGLLAGLLVGLLSISITMVLLNAAQNIYQTTENTEALYYLTERMRSSRPQQYIPAAPVYRAEPAPTYSQQVNPPAPTGEPASDNYAARPMPQRVPRPQPTEQPGLTICGGCGEEIPVGHHFCGKCGSPENH